MKKHRIAVDTAVSGEVRVAAIHSAMAGRFHRNRFEILSAPLDQPRIMNTTLEESSEEATGRSMQALAMHKTDFGIGFATFAWSYRGIPQEITTMVISDATSPLVGTLLMVLNDDHEARLLEGQLATYLNKVRDRREDLRDMNLKTVRLLQLLLGTIVDMSPLNSPRVM